MLDNPKNSTPIFCSCNAIFQAHHQIRHQLAPPHHIYPHHLHCHHLIITPIVITYLYLQHHHQQQLPSHYPPYPQPNTVIAVSCIIIGSSITINLLTIIVVMIVIMRIIGDLKVKLMAILWELVEMGMPVQVAINLLLLSSLIMDHHRLMSKIIIIINIKIK